MKTEIKIGDKVRITSSDILRNFRSKHEILRILKETGKLQPFTRGSGKYAGQMVPESPREDSDYLFDTIDGFVFKTSWMAHPTAGCDWERDKFQLLEVALRIGEIRSLKAFWVEKVDGILPNCVHCSEDTRNWNKTHWSCLKCVDRGITTWVSKPCGPCGCPDWIHGGVSGCYGAPERPCDGCAGFVPDESADDMICPQERYDKIIAFRRESAKEWRDQVTSQISEDVEE